jgi:hypothetical protein
MSFEFKNFLPLTQNAMLTILAKQNVPTETKGEIIRAVREEKKRLRSVAAKRTQFRRLWAELIDPLDYEVRLIERMNRYRGSVERDAALRGYLMVLAKVRQRMLKHEYLGEQTPSDVAKDKRYPNNGVHWSDWVPMDVKEAVLDAFAAIPRERKKVKVPFARKIPKVLHNKLKTRLIDRTKKEYDHEFRANSIDYTDERAALLKRMKQALEWIETLEVGEAMPTTWHGFYK